MLMFPRWKMLFVLFAFALGSCAPLQAVTATPSTVFVPSTREAETQMPLGPATQGVETPMSPITPLPQPGLDGLAESAIQDLAKRLAVRSEDITVVQVAQVVWSNSSLGCPKQGMAYADVLSPGFLVVLRSGEQKFEYHAGSDRSLFYCENPVGPSSLNPNSI